MNASNLVSVLACCVLGCGAVVQPGLANAPVLGGATPETRVHDAIANGHDACERSMFPQGEVLRGQIPPCSKESLTKTTAFSPRPTTAGTPLSVPYPLGLCALGSRSLESGAEGGATAFAFSGSTPPRWLCDSRWGADGAAVFGAGVSIVRANVDGGRPCDRDPSRCPR
jgi:hypothetical protein